VLSQTMQTWSQTAKNRGQPRGSRTSRLNIAKMILFPIPSLLKIRQPLYITREHYLRRTRRLIALCRHILTRRFYEISISSYSRKYNEYFSVVLTLFYTVFKCLKPSSQEKNLLSGPVGLCYNVPSSQHHSSPLYILPLGTVLDSF